MKRIRSLLETIQTIVAFPVKLLALPMFIKQRKVLREEYRVGEWVRRKEPRDGNVRVMIGPEVVKHFSMHNLGETDEQGSRELQDPTFIPTTVAYMFFEEYEPFEIVEVHMLNLLNEVLMHLRFHNLDQGHPCHLTIRNKRALLGKNTMTFVPGELVEKVPPPHESFEPL